MGFTVSKNHMCEQHHAGHHLDRIVPVEHGPVHPGWRESRAERISAGVKPVGMQTPFIKGLGMRPRRYRQNVLPRPHRALAGLKRDTRGLVQLQMAVGRCTDRNRAHTGYMVMAVGSGKLQGELIRIRQLAPAGFVAAQQRVIAGSDDEFITRIIAVANEDLFMHGGQDSPLVHTGCGKIEGGLEGRVIELGGLSDTRDFRGAFDQAQSVYKVRSVR